MRVLHVTSGRLFGGIEQMLLTIARHAAVTPEIEATFAVAAPGRLEQELRAAGAPTISLGNVRLSRPPSIVQARARFARVLDELCPAAIVYHAPWSYALFARAAQHRGIRVVLWQHDHAAGAGVIERWTRRTRADLVICNSRWTAASAGNLQPGVRISVIHPPSAIAMPAADTRSGIRQSLGAGADDVIVLSASRMEPWKGHVSVLRALAAIQDLPSWTMWMAGGAQRPHEARYAARLANEASRLGIQARVRFLGERRDLPALMAAADLFCQMNERPEPFGVVFAEALYSCLPVVTASLGGAPEIVSDACGRLVVAGDGHALSLALRDVIGDSALRARLGAAGPAHAAALCAPDVVLPRLAQTLQSLGASAAA
ncbi:MAG TPA: glycosyltransferase [Vicinamibacterales bacterium]|nr:glycosyltransferase [Vicinamibacterales bacterium]